MKSKHAFKPTVDGTLEDRAVPSAGIHASVVTYPGFTGAPTSTTPPTFILSGPPSAHTTYPGFTGAPTSTTPPSFVLSGPPSSHTTYPGFTGAPTSPTPPTFVLSGGKSGPAPSFISPTKALAPTPYVAFNANAPAAYAGTSSPGAFTSFLANNNYNHGTFSGNYHGPAGTGVNSGVGHGSPTNIYY